MSVEAGHRLRQPLRDFHTQLLMLRCHRLIFAVGMRQIPSPICVAGLV